VFIDGGAGGWDLEEDRALELVVANIVSTGMFRSFPLG
jgi:hypothetical protein